MLYALRAQLLYTGRPEEPLKGKWVVFDSESKLIVGVVDEPPSGVERLDYGPVVTPALVDPHSHIGMVRHGEPIWEEESNEKMDSVLPLVDAIHSIYMDDEYFLESVEHGVLYSCVLPGSGNVIGGRAALIRNWASRIDDAYIKSCGVKAALGFNPRSTTSWRGTRPHTRMGVVALLDKWLRRAEEAADALKLGEKRVSDLEAEVRALLPVVEGREVLRVHVHRSDDIAALLMLLRRHPRVRVTVEHACAVRDRRTFEDLARLGIHLVYGPLDAHAYKTELKWESYRNVRLLLEAEPRPHFSLMSDHPVVLQRNLLLQTRFLLRYGASKSEALAAVTSRPAETLGLNAGVIEAGKLASLVVWSGDPFSLDSRVTAVIAEGEPMEVPL